MSPMNQITKHEKVGLLVRTIERCAILSDENNRLRRRIAELEAMTQAAEDPELGWADASWGGR